jgi:hypothetical protein
MSGPLGKHKLNGIGGASSAMVLASLASNPGTLFLTQGLSGIIVGWILRKVFSSLASLGLVMANVGVEKLITIVDKIDFDGSFESAEELIKAIQDSGRNLTPEEAATIDQKVIDSFRKFGKLGRRKKA